MIEIWNEDSRLVIIHIYNPCKKLKIVDFGLLEGQEERRVVWCGDFNVHNTLWGGDRTDQNGTVIEGFMDTKDLVCLNDGSSTRINPKMQSKSVLDLTLI